jgi:hypothetical protein
MFPLTKTDIAKMAVRMAVALKITQIAEQQVGQLTSFDTETVSVKVGTTLTGHLVAWKLAPFTDKAVDVVIAKFKSLRPNKIA